MNLYRCENPACALGSRSAPGHFTGGISQAQAELLSGDPEALSGEGVCPNCGVSGELESEEYE